MARIAITPGNRHLPFIFLLLEIFWVQSSGPEYSGHLQLTGDGEPVPWSNLNILDSWRFQIIKDFLQKFAECYQFWRAAILSAFRGPGIRGPWGAGPD